MTFMYSIHYILSMNSIVTVITSVVMCLPVFIPCVANYFVKAKFMTIVRYGTT